MWDKETSKTKKPEETSVEGNTENSASRYFKRNNLYENVSPGTDTVVVATYVVNDDDDCADNRRNVTERSRPLGTEQNDIDHLLSIVQLSDGPSTSSSSHKNVLPNKVPYSAKLSDLKSVLPTSAASMSTAAKEIPNTEELTVAIDNDELPYKNKNIKSQSSMQSNKSAISVKYSPITRKPTQNEKVPEQRSKHIPSDNVAGPQIQNLYDKSLNLSTEDLQSATRAYSTASVEDLTSMSENRVCSPSPSSVTSASTLRFARSTSGRRMDCLRHMRRPPKEPEEYLDALFPHIRKAHNQIRKALLHAPLTDVKDNALLKKKMLELIQVYTSGCKDEFERVGPSLVLCRRLKRNIIRVLDLFHEICASSREDHAYLYHISQLIAVYTSLEIRLSFNLTRLQKCALIHRISHIINKHLMVKNESVAKENILRMFLRMPDTYSQRFIMEPLFNTFLQEIPTSSHTWCQKELPDKVFVQYIIILHIWKEMLRDPLEQVELINRAQHFMCPTKTLHANPMYANHLPTIHTRKHAVKDILNSLKFFQDLRNAAICDDTLHDGDDDIEVVIDEVINTPFWDFGASYIGDSKQTKQLNRRVITADPSECVDLTQEDEQQSRIDTPLEWLTKLKERAAERVQVDESEKVICLDSDSDGELFCGSILDPSESYQDCDAVDTDYTSLDGSTTDDKELSEDEVLSGNGITHNGLRTYLAPRTKNQINVTNEKRATTCTTLVTDPYERTRDCDGEGDSAAVGTKKSTVATTVTTAESTLPLIVNSFTVRGKQNMHLLNSPRFSLDIGPERLGSEDIEFHDTSDDVRELTVNLKGTKNQNHVKRAVSNEHTARLATSVGGYYEKELNNDVTEEEDEYNSLPSTATSSTTTLGKVIYTQTLMRPSQDFLTEYDDEREDDYNHTDGTAQNVVDDVGNKADNKKQMLLLGDDKPVKKQVKFNDNPIGPTRRPHTKLPIKPAIHLSKIQANNQQPIFSNSPQPRFLSPSSSTSSTTESLKQMAQKEHINAIPTLFSGYKITKPPLTGGAAARNAGNSSNNTTLVKKSKYKAGPKSMHMSRKTTAMSSSGARKNSTHSPQSPRSDANSQSPTKRNHSTSPVSLRANSPVKISPETAADPKLNMKCAVLMRESEEVIKYKRQQVAFINELLEKQREMQRQRALKRQEFQNILKQKREEGKRLMAEISQIKKQQVEAHEKVLETQLQQPRQSPTILNRKRLLVKEKNVTFKTHSKARSRSTTPNRTSNVENVAAEAEKDVDTTSAAIMQTVIGDTFELVAEAMPLSDGVNRSTAALKNIKATQVQDQKSATSIRLTAGMTNEEAANTLTNAPKTKVQSTTSKLSTIENVNSALQLCKASNDDTPNKAIKTNITAIETQPNKIVQKAEELTGTEMQRKVVPTTSKTSFSENSKIPALQALATAAAYTRCARSMTPTRGVYDTTKQSEVQTERTTDNLLVNCSLSSPTSSRTRLQRAPSLSPSIFMNRNRVEVRRSMQDPTSNTDFTVNNTSWLLPESPRTLTKTLKVRLKRLQHLNMSATAPSSPEKETSDKMLMPPSVTPTFSMECATNAAPTVALAVTETSKISSLEFHMNNNRHKRVQLLKHKLRKELLELETYVRSADTKAEIPHLQLANDVACSQATQTAEGRISKVARRKPQRRPQQNNKKLRLLEQVILERHTNKMQTELRLKDDSACDNADSKKAKTAKVDIEDGLQCDRNQEDTKEIVRDTLANECNDVGHNSSQLPLDTSVNGVKKAFAQHRENIEDVRRKERTTKNSMVIDCSNASDKKHKRTHKHGAIVTQVVDVTPGRHVNDSLLSDLLLTAAANNSAVLNDVLNTTPKLDVIEPTASELQIPGNANAPSATPTVDVPTFVKPNNLLAEGGNDKKHIEITNEMAVAVSGLAMLANRPITTTTTNTETCINAHALHNEMPKRASSELFSMHPSVAEPTTVIGLLNDTQTQSITSNDEPATIVTAKPRVIEPHPNELITLPNDTDCMSEGEESSSDCLLSQLSKRVHKMSELESIVDATTVHVIKDATMALMSFEATPTLPAYLLNGESRDVPTPPAIATPAPPTPTADLTPEAEQPKPPPTPPPPLPELMVKENTPTPPTPMPIVPIIREPSIKPNNSTAATVSVQVIEPVREHMISLPVAPQQAHEEQIIIEQDLCNNHLSPPLVQDQQLEEEVNSPAPASAISTSDHEVSSTQEIIYTPTKRSNANTLNNSAGMAIPPTPIDEEAAMLVQNSQIDTTHHLPESSYYMRKRARKFSDEFTMCENKNENSTKDIMKQRRKTFSSESCLPIQFSTNNTTFTKKANNEHANSSATASTSNGINNGGQNSGGSSPSTTTEPVTKQVQPRRRNHTQKRNNSQSPLTGRSRAGGSVGELNGTFVYSCSRLQATNMDIADMERCVVLPASAVVPPVNLGNIARTYSKNNLAQIKVFVPPEVEMCLENEDGEKDISVATTTSKRGRPKNSVTKGTRKQPKLESADKVKAKKTATNITKTKAVVQPANKRDKADTHPQIQLEDGKSSKSAASTKAPTRAKNVERAHQRKRK